ncbi:MAG: type II secretion system F family protein [Candidatus Moranbacteria bacterium]|nr:type II secretion system F family protein [Candidatus Moranbacteria bacterium]
MAKFIYTAKSGSGESKGGEIVAPDERALAQQLRSEGFLVTSVKMVEERKKGIEVKLLDRFLTVPLKEKMIFARNLAVMIASGLTVSRAINNLSGQTRNKRFKKILSDIYEQLQQGKTLSEGLAKYPAVFSELFVNMVRVGETGGNLEEILQIIAVQLEKEHDLISKIRGAMVYPSVIIVAMIGIAILMLTYILPKITGVFKDMDVQLPASTRFVIAVSDFLRDHTILVTFMFVFFAFFLKVFLQTKAGKKIVSFLVIHLPIVRNIVIKVNCARFARIFSSLLKSGIPVIDALKIVSNTLTNYYYKKVIEESIEQVQKGVSISTVITKHPGIFPVLVPQMLEVGEETGKTEAVLMKLAEFYEQEVDQITKNMSSIIEPVLMIIIGGAVGFFAVSMLQPMYSLMENIK